MVVSKKLFLLQGGKKLLLFLTSGSEKLFLVLWELSRFSELKNSINRNLRVNSWMSFF